MRSIKREAKGISPVIATILLIAVTAVAGGVIAAYVAGLYVAGGRVIIASANGMVYDYDNAAGLENYRNGGIGITVIIQPGSATVRSIGDPAYGATTITVSNPTTGFTASVGVSGVDNWGKSYTLNSETTVSTWSGAGDDSNKVRLNVTLSPDSQGRLVAGGLVSITLQPFLVADAHSLTGATGDDAGENSTPENRRTFAEMWNERHTFNVTITGRDSISLTGFDGAYLTGVSWYI